MKNITSISVLSFVLLIILLAACRTDFEVYAPEQEVYVVYGVLDSEDSVQYVRVSKAYQVDGDAFVYASQNDLSREGLDIQIKGNGATYQGVPVTDIPKDSTGIFLPSQTVYRFVTDGTTDAPRLVNEAQYNLTIGVGDKPNFITAKTILPGVPQLREPISPNAGGGQDSCLKKLLLEGRVRFEWNNVERTFCSDRTISYEVRAKLFFQENGVDRVIEYGPTDPEKCNSGAGCNGVSDSRVCMQFGEREVLNYFKLFMPESPNLAYTYDNSPDCFYNTSALPSSFIVEITAIDEFLSNYMEVNNPSVVDLSGARLEYTNINSEDAVTVGIFGSTTSYEAPFLMTPCSEYLLDLNGTLQPFTSCVK